MAINCNKFQQMPRMGHYIGQSNQQVFVKHSSFYARKQSCRLQLIKPASQLPKETTQVSRKLTKIVPFKITASITMKPHQTQKIVTKTTDQIQKMKAKRDTNNLTHHHQPLIVTANRNKLTTSSNPTEN